LYGIYFKLFGEFMTEEMKIYNPEIPAGRKPLINFDEYKKLYDFSITNPDKFWAEQADKFITWDKKYEQVKDSSFSENLHIKWFEGGKLNISYNCIDRHLEKRGDQTAIIWEGDNPSESKKITYKQLHFEVCKFANILKNLGVKKGDVVTIYMPMILEAAYAMLACTRIGAVHSVVFGGFSPEALKGRIEDGNSKLVITSDEGLRGGKKVPLKNNVDESLKILGASDVKTLVVKRTGGQINWHQNDVWYHEEYEKASSECAPEIMDAEDPLFILYTSGSTGRPKGIMHTTAGYLLYAAITHKYVFDYQDGDVYWCTADVGWITGHSYILYGPLCNGAITLMFEGIPTYPDITRFWQVVDKHKVNVFYTAPTAIRSLMASGEKTIEGTSRESLRILGSVGEPINPEAWRWYHRVIGNSKCPIVDTWWQTETGGFLITPLPYATLQKPGSATFPFFGVKPAIVDKDNNILEGACEGNLCILDSWPGQARSIWGDHKRFFETYFSSFAGKYFTGDGAKRDADGYYWITGRVDDVINVSGHRLGTAEIESALVAHPSVAEAAVVGYPHDIKGQGIYAYVSLNIGIKISDELLKSLNAKVRELIGPIATPDKIQIANIGLPKTRSGKIMRRILRKIAANDYGDLGDTKTLLNPEAVQDLIDGRLV
jgi:acetyl-CoA synthetase